MLTRLAAAALAPALVAALYAFAVYPAFVRVSATLATIGGGELMRPYVTSERGGLVPDMAAALYVRRDTINPREWRLAWMVPGSDSFCHDTGECDTSGRFRTMAAARAYGLRHYGETATRADW